MAANTDTLSVADTARVREEEGTDTMREQSLPEAFESMMATIADGLRGVLLVMTKKTSASLVGTSLTIMIDSFQLIAFTLTDATLERIDTTGALAIMSKGLSTFQFGGKLIQWFGFSSTLTFALTIVLLELFNIAYVAHCWTKKRFEFLWAIKALRYSASLLVGVLYIPIVSVMGTMIDCTGVAGTMGSDVCVGLRPFVLTVMSLFILVSLVLSSAFFDASPASGSPASKPHSRVDVFHLVIKTAASLLYVGQSSPSFGLEAWHAFLAVSGVTLAALNIWYLPWFHPTVLSLRCMCMAVFGWVATYVCISVTLNLPENPVILICSSLLVLPLARLLAFKRMQELGSKRIENCKDCFEVEIKIRYLLLENKVMFQSSKHHVHPEYRTVEQSDDVLKRATDMYEVAMRQLSTSSLICAFQAEFVYGFDLKNYTLLARRAVLEGESRRPYFDVSFTLFKMRNRLKQKVATDGDVMSYVASEKYEREATAADRKCCTILLEFWKELGSRSPDMNRVRKLATQAAELSHRANTAYSSLVRVQPKSGRALSMYSGFLNDVANDRAKANHLAQKAVYVNSREGKRSGKEQLAGELSDMFPVIAFDVNGGERSFGEILSANAAAAQSLNETSERLIRRDVRSFTVPPLSSDLDRMIAEYFETGMTAFLDDPERTFIVTSSGDCLEVEMRLVPYTKDGMDYSFFLTWAPFIYNNISWIDGQPFFLLDTNNLIISYSRPCREFLEMNSMLSTPVALEEVFLNYNEARDIFLQDPSKRAEVHLAFPKQVAENEEYRAKYFISIETVRGGREAPMTKVVVHFTEKEEMVYRRTMVDEEDDEDYNDSASNPGDQTFDDYVTPRALAPAQGSSGANLVPGSPPYPLSSGASFSAKRSGTFSMTLNRRVFVASELDQKKSQRQQQGGGEQKEEEENSQVGTSSVISAAAIRFALRKQSNNNKLSPILAKLRRSYLEVLLLVVACAGIVLVVQQSLLHTFASNVEFTGQAGLRRTCAVSIAFAAHSLVLLNHGATLHAYMDEEFARNEMLSAATQLQTTDTLLFEQRKLLSSELQNLYEIPTTALHYLVNEEVITRNHTLFDASSKLAGKAVQAAKAPLSDFNLESDMVFFLMNNIEGSQSFLATLNQSTKKFSSDTLKLQAQIFVVTITLMGVALVLEVIVMIAVMSPIIGGIERNKTKVLNVFSGIPVGTVRDIVSRFQDRLSTVHGVLMDVALDEEAAAEQQIMLSSLAPPPLPMPFPKHPATPRKTVTPGPESESGVEKKRSEKKKVMDKATKKKLKARQSRRRVGSRHKLFLFKLGSIILLSVIYFSSSLYYGVLAFRETLTNAPQEANLGGLRRTHAKHAIHLMRLIASGTVIAYKDHDFTARKKYLLDVLHELQTTEHAVMYGDEALDITGLVALENPPEEEVTLMFSDGCVHWISTVHTHEECLNFNFGMFSSGLHGVLSDYIDSMTEVLDAFHSQPTFQELLLNEGEASIVRMDPVELINKTFSHPELEILAELENWFLQPQLTVSVMVLSEKLADELSHLDSLRITFFLVYISLLFCLYIFIVRRVIKALDAEVKHTRSLLLMIPEDALDGLRSVQKFLTEEFRDSLE